MRDFFLILCAPASRTKQGDSAAYFRVADKWDRSRRPKRQTGRTTSPTPELPRNDASTSARGRRAARSRAPPRPVRSPPAPRGVRGREHGRCGCCSRAAVCSDGTTDPFPYIRTTAIRHFAKFFSVISKPSSGSANADSPIGFISCRERRICRANAS